MKDNNDPMLENNSYYDIDILNEAQKKINEWKEKYNNASGNMGKWFCQLQIDKLTKKLIFIRNNGLFKGKLKSPENFS